VEVWEDNWEAIALYRKYASQWRMNGRGPAALDMGIFFHELDRKGVNGAEYDEMVGKLSIIESAALKWIYRS
jgi:hypothetical protein